MKQLRMTVCIALVVVTTIFTSSAFAASAGTVRGKVLGPDGQPMAGILVQLRNDITGFKQNAASGADGTFAFNNIPFNAY